jgi:hypothetical protein
MDRWVTNMEHGTCDGCTYAALSVSDREEEFVVLKCRRYPPVLMLDSNDEILQSFPDATDRCGEFAE